MGDLENTSVVLPIESYKLNLDHGNLASCSRGAYEIEDANLIDLDGRLS